MWYFTVLPAKCHLVTKWPLWSLQMAKIVDKQCRVLHFRAFLTKPCPVLIHPCGCDATVFLGLSVTPTGTFPIKQQNSYILTI